jgi:glycosyltransferase involved in cell wall biosynthesis
MLVSILIPTLLERSSVFQPKLESLYKQIKDNNLEKKVEIIVITDNRTMKLSEKRNTMQKLARGKYFTHLDDDDNFTDDYCKKVVEHIEQLKVNHTEYPDIIGYDQKCFVGDQVFVVKPSLNHTFRLELSPANVKHPYDVPVYYRLPWQFNLWRTERFQHVWRTDADTNAREDQNWLKRVYLEYPKSMSIIENYIGHYYNFQDPSKSTCQ